LDLPQPVELYFESLAGSRNPFPVHADEFSTGSVRFAQERAIDPIESGGPAIGADPAQAPSQATANGFAFLIEDPATIWHLGPQINCIGSRSAGDPERSRSGIPKIRRRHQLSSNHLE
jgi:hypothetical protein